MESNEIFEIFLGTRCQGCGRAKRTHQAFCSMCYRHLPGALRKSLWKRFGNGFEEAYQGSLSWFRLHPVLKSKPGQGQLFEERSKS